MTKLHEDVIFTYDKDNYMDPWHIGTKFSDHVDLTFSPFFERVSKTNAQLVQTNVNQLVGYFNGRIELHDGSTLRFRQMLGCAEDHRAKW